MPWEDFESEEARREYFREELRKKLPELKQIEGFPIGEDEDIIRLSDPPYYTACPNPWLNDFIAEWEKKRRNWKTGKRSSNSSKVPYASDVSEGKNNPIYMAHAYHTKVPHPQLCYICTIHNLATSFSMDLRNRNDRVAANLCGSTVDVAALREPNAKVGVRHSICSDLSPIASLIAANYNLPFDPVTFEKKANTILKQVEKEYGWMYETEVNGRRAKVHYTIWSDVFICSNCNKELTLWKEAVILGRKKDEIKDEFPCPYCGTLCSKKNMGKAWETYFYSVLKKPISMIKTEPVLVNYHFVGSRSENRLANFDIKLLEEIDKIDIINIPLFRLPVGSEARRNDRIGIKYIHQFFTKRNLLCLNKIYEYSKNDISLLNWFTSSLINTSKMWKYKPDRKGGNLAGTLYIPSLSIEQNPIEVLRRKISAFIKTMYYERSNW